MDEHVNTQKGRSTMVFKCNTQECLVQRPKTKGLFRGSTTVFKCKTQECLDLKTKGLFRSKDKDHAKIKRLKSV